MEYISLIIAGILSGICASMGLGGGFVLLIYLNLFTQTEQLEAQLLNLCFFVPIAILSVYMHSVNGNIEKKIVKMTFILGIVGVIIGASVAFIINAKILSQVFGVFILIVGLKEMFHKKEEEKHNCQQ